MVALACLSSHAAAMGSGPHPNVPYGIPPSPRHGVPVVLPDDTASPEKSEMARTGSMLRLLLLLLIPFLASAGLFSMGLLTWSIPPERKK